MVFIRGGNGSGKSNLHECTRGLYPLQGGEFFERHAAFGRAWRRTATSTILPSDFHLFSRPLGSGCFVPRMRKVLHLMRIESKVRLEPDGSFSTLDLSAGQRKRLALACALLEDREVYLFDEVAADFDPGFRVFHEEFLPDLQREGKTILAIFMTTAISSGGPGSGICVTACSRTMDMRETGHESRSCAWPSALCPAGGPSTDYHVVAHKTNIEEMRALYNKVNQTLPSVVNAKEHVAIIHDRLECYAENTDYAPASGFVITPTSKRWCCGHYEMYDPIAPGYGDVCDQYKSLSCHV